MDKLQAKVEPVFNTAMDLVEIYALKNIFQLPDGIIFEQQPEHNYTEEELRAAQTELTKLQQQINAVSTFVFSFLLFVCLFVCDSVPVVNNHVDCSLFPMYRPLRSTTHYGEKVLLVFLVVLVSSG